jgi:predicted NUDIX family NTP pyrophosphohydrolase
MVKKSAGILLYRSNFRKIEFLLVHPGGPFWSKKDLGAWSIPKGEFTEEENPLDAATREFEEELGEKLSGKFISLKPMKQAGGKLVYAFALEHNLDVSNIRSNTFTIEWPQKSGKHQEFPEVDKAGWFDANTSRIKLNPGQVAFIDELLDILKQ